MSNPTELPDLDRLSELSDEALGALKPWVVRQIISVARGAQQEGEAPQGQIEYCAPITVTSMTLGKREFLEQKGYSVVGYVMQDAKGDRCTVSHGKVEWEAEIMKDYYQGVGPEPEYDEQATTAKNAAVRFDSKVVPWNERIGRKSGVHDGVIKFAMLEEIAELREALASRPAEVDDEQLPPLPPEAARAMKGAAAFFVKWQDAGKDLRGALMLYTADQYRQGQRDAVAADRARREKGGA